MNVNTAVTALVSLNPSDADIRRVFHNLSSDELRKMVNNLSAAIERCEQNDPTHRAQDIARRAANVAQAILDARVCVAS